MDLQKLFNPTSIAIVGVSHEPNKVGHLVAKNLYDQGYQGEAFFVNYKYKGKILGKIVYQSLKEIKQPIDLVVLAVPADVAIDYLDELHDLKIKYAVIFAAGFKETGKDGEEKEQILLTKAKKYGINILGPNCIGYVNTENKINLTFLKDVCPKGNIGFISQSGALGSMLVDYFLAHINLGLSYFISLGNKTVIDESDCLEYLAKDKNTDVIAMYLEDIKDGQKFLQTVKKITGLKPIIVLKSGATKEGSQAAVSHTGGMVGDDDVYSAIFKQTGIIRAQSIGEFQALLKIFSYQRLPANETVLILSNAGGAGVLLTDGLIKNRLSLMMISEKIKQELEKIENYKKITVHNPIDLLGDASAFDYEKVINRMIKEKNIGSIIVLLTPQANTQITETATVIETVQKKFDRPIYPIFMGKKSMAGVGKFFEENKIAGFANFDYLPTVLAKVNWWLASQRSGRGRKENEMTGILDKLDSFDRNVETYCNTSLAKYNLSDSLKLLESIGIPIAPIYLVKSLNTLRIAASKIRFPLVAKIALDKITHKTEVNGVITNIKNEKDLMTAYHELTSIKSINSCYIQPQIKGFELLIGAKRDPIFGIVLVIGLGGIFTELLKDIAYRIYPFGYNDFLTMVKETRVEKLLNGFRGAKPIDSHKIFGILMKVGQLMESCKEIKEIDINPLIVSDKNISAVDARIIML